MNRRWLLAVLAFASLSRAECASHEPAWVPPVVPRPLASAPVVARPAPAVSTVAPSPAASTVVQAEPPPVAPEPVTEAEAEAEAAPRCADAPALLPDGSVPHAPPHAPLGEDVEIPGDRAAYVLPGRPEDPRVIVYLHGMCGDVTAADYFREAVRAHGTLIALRGDTACRNGRFKWRDDASKIQARIQTAFKRVSELRGGHLTLEGALLFGYSQGAERAERVAQRFPQQYPRVVLGGPPTKASPIKLARAQRVAILGGELETTDNMHAGFDALVAAGIAARFFTLECAHHGYFGARPESQLGEVLDWVSAGE